MRFGPNTKEVEALIESHEGLSLGRLRRPPREDWLLAVERARAAARKHGRLRAWNGLIRRLKNGLYFEGRSMKMSAACALVVRDLISPEDFEVLYSPWREVIEGDQG